MCSLTCTCFLVITSAGLTKVSVRDYLIGTVGVIPGTIAFVFIGASTAGTMNEGVSLHPQISKWSMFIPWPIENTDLDSTNLYSMTHWKDRLQDDKPQHWPPFSPMLRFAFEYWSFDFGFCVSRLLTVCERAWTWVSWRDTCREFFNRMKACWQHVCRYADGPSPQTTSSQVPTEMNLTVSVNIPI